MIILKYNIPLPFKVSTNAIYAWIHWQKRKSIADWYHRLTKEDCEKFYPIEWKVDLLFEFYFKTRYLDSSNCSFIWKMIEDSLVKNWLLKNDTNEFVWKVTFESILMDKKERKELEEDFIRITIK